MATNSTKESATVYDLPDELLTSIFERLKFKDLIQCSLVCKRFKLICKHVKIAELIISNKIENLKDYWFYTKNQFTHQDAVDVTTFCSYRSTFGLNKFRRLYFEGTQPEYDELNVNELTQLQQLKVRVEGIRLLDYVFHIDLPNLTMIDIDPTHVEEWTFIVTAPKLDVLKCFDLTDIQLTYPNCIRHLEMIYYSQPLQVLENVQFFQVEQYTLREIMLSNILSVFPKLTTLAILQYNDSEIDLRDLIRQKQKLRRPELEIYFQSVELNDIKRIDEHESYRNLLEFQMDNYNSLRGDISFHFAMIYDKVMDLMGGKIPEDFSTKYFNTRCIYVYEKVENQEHLFRFIKSFDFLNQLTLEGNTFDQSFYDRLGELNQLTSLKVRNSSTPISDYNFLLKLKLLQTFLTDADTANPSELTLTLFRHLKYFRSMVFNCKMERIVVKRHLQVKSNNFELRWFDYKKRRLDITELARALDDLKTLFSRF